MEFYSQCLEQWDLTWLIHFWIVHEVYAVQNKFNWNFYEDQSHSMLLKRYACQSSNVVARVVAPLPWLFAVRLCRKILFPIFALNVPVIIPYTIGLTQLAAKDNICEISLQATISGVNGKLDSSKFNHELIMCVGSQQTHQRVVTKTTSFVAFVLVRRCFSAFCIRTSSMFALGVMLPIKVVWSTLDFSAVVFTT